MKINIIIQNCNQCVLDGPLVVLNKLYKEYEYKHPNAWHIQMRGNSNWDGKVHYINDRGKFRIGLLPQIYKRLIELKHTVKIIDQRPPLPIKPVLPKVIGNLKPRKEQIAVLEAIINNKVGNTPFYIGVQDLSVNFGKTLIMAAMYLAFKKQLKTLLITNDSDWMDQSKAEFPELLPGENITFVQGSKVTNWSQFSIGMVQSISINIGTYQRELSSVDMVLIDECDLADNKTYKNVIEHLWNTRVRLGLSGTIYLNTLKKDLIFHTNIRSFLGDRVNEVRLADTIKSGNSTPVVVKLVPTEFNIPNKHFKKGYIEEYDEVITNNLKAYDLSFKRAMYNMNKGRKPMLIVTKYISHCELLYKYYNSRLDKSLSIAYVTHKSKDRKQVIQRFREGKIDILISNTFIARGKNFPLLRYLQNAAGMDSNEKTIQLLGRLVRTHKSKSKAYMDDIAYNGKYLSRHAKHRKNYYLKENLRVMKLRIREYPIKFKSTN